MIFKEEIQKIATDKKLGIDIVEKDYILSWVLAGIHHHAATKNSWIFKGGTCLKNAPLKMFRNPLFLLLPTRRIELRTY